MLNEVDDLRRQEVHSPGARLGRWNQDPRCPDGALRSDIRSPVKRQPSFSQSHCHPRTTRCCLYVSTDHCLKPFTFLYNSPFRLFFLPSLNISSIHRNFRDEEDRAHPSFDSSTICSTPRSQCGSRQPSSLRDYRHAPLRTSTNTCQLVSPRHLFLFEFWSNPVSSLSAASDYMVLSDCFMHYKHASAISWLTREVPRGEAGRYVLLWEGVAT